MRVRGKISIAFLISFLSFILCFILGFIVIDLYYTFYTFQGDPQDYVIFIFLVALPFCGSYVGFCLCYSGKLYVKRGFSALIVSALFGMIPITILLIFLLWRLNSEISTITDIDSDFDADAIRAGCLDISYITPPFFQKENDFPYQEVFLIHVIEGKQFTKPEINSISRYYMLLPEKSHAEIIEVSKNTSNFLHRFLTAGE